MTQQVPARARGEQIQALLLQPCKCSFLPSEKARQGLATFSSTLEDRVVERRFQPQVSQVLVGVLDDVDDGLVAILCGDLIHRQMCNQR